MVSEEREMPFEFVAMEAMLIKKVRKRFKVGTVGSL